jgi:fluoride ion exporter CrcB/FEX
MFNFNKSQEDPQKALENARNVVNKGLMGGLTKAFMGQGFVEKMNTAMDQGQAAIDNINQVNWVARNGLDASAAVLSVMDTGATINMNPVVELKLHIIPASGAAFEATARTMVSRIAVPRKGDKINIKYNPANVSQIFVLP